MLKRYNSTCFNKENKENKYHNSILITAVTRICTKMQPIYYRSR